MDGTESRKFFSSTFVSHELIYEMHINILLTLGNEAVHCIKGRICMVRSSFGVASSY